MAKTAFVNLSTGDIQINQTETSVLRKYLGGRGYASKLLFDLVGPEVEPLSPENALIFSMGPFGGTTWPTSGRGHVTFKSPATGVYGHANAGGFWGAEFAKAGYDALVITGKAATPVYLYVTDSGIEIRAADDLWGMEVSPLSDRLEGPEKAKVACIGPAGENLVLIAGIMNDRNRAAARAGGGAVMGSKLLKAVVVKADGRLMVPEEFKVRAKAATKHIQTDSKLDNLRRYGTSILVNFQNASGVLPSKNHQRVQIPFISKLNAQKLDEYVLKGKGCYACPLRCGRVSKVEDGKYACDLGGPEYETLSALGPMPFVENIEAIIYANLRCNELGLDTISTGVVVSFAMECYEKGLLQDAGMPIEWGDEEVLLKLIELIAQREGIGDLLADGTKRAAEKIGGGAEKYAMQVKGLELPRQDPRLAKAFGLAHATSNRGADHMYALPTIDAVGALDVAKKYFPDEWTDEILDSYNERYKPDIVVLGERFCAVTDALGICKFTTAEDFSLMPQDLADGLSAYWGDDVSEEELLETGERIVALERMYNVRIGLSRKDDRLPERFTSEPVNVWQYTYDEETGKDVESEEPVRANAVVEDMEAMLDRYYDLNGYGQDGIPTGETLERLGLGFTQ
jgi:aldehyde:ferredoxin oxidoreductase